MLVDLAVDAISEDLSQQQDMESLRIFLPGHVVDTNDVPDICAFATSKARSLDLLVCLASASSKSFRRATLVDPFPRCFLAEDGGEDLALFSRALAYIPPIATLRGGSSQADRISGTDAEETREALRGDAAVLLRWLIDLKGVHVKPDAESGTCPCISCQSAFLCFALILPRFLIETNPFISDRHHAGRHCFSLP